MRRVTIAVIGNGKTTRSNVDALLSDMVDSVDQMSIIVIYDKTMSEGVVWAKQFAEDHSISLVEISDNKFEEITEHATLQDLRFFVLWDDDDIDCQSAAAFAQKWAIPAYDLTDGLIRIPFNSETIVQPQVVVMPVIESVISDPVVEAVAAITEALDLDLETEPEDVVESDEYDLPELIKLAVEQAGKDLARAFFDEFKKLLDK
jgi:hypothetical protein